MNGESTHSSDRFNWPQRLPFYYGWVQVVLAALAMTATMPGRTHGLGLITESLLASLELDRAWFARANFVASLIGATFCLPTGWLIDRRGVRSALVLISAALGVSVIAMCQAQSEIQLFVCLLLVRGFGQSALSVASMAAIGKWFDHRTGIAMGVFAILLTLGFIAGVLIVGPAIEHLGWRAAWSGLGYGVLSLTPLFWLLARNSPAACDLPDDAPTHAALPRLEETMGYSLWQALATPAFWAILLGSCAFNFVWSGVTLFNESILAERGLDAKDSIEIMAILTGVGLLANVLGGLLATRRFVVRLLGLSMILLSVALWIFPQIHSLAMARSYAAAIGFSGGLVTVVFFAAWGHLFGRDQLGRIQGVAQFATVLASALGPVFFAEIWTVYDSYSPAFRGLAIATGMLAIVALVAPLPAARAGLK